MEKLEKIQTPEKKAEEVLSLAELVEERERQMKKEAKEVKQAGEERIKWVAGDIGATPKSVEQEKEKMGFGEKTKEVSEKIRTLLEDTREKMKQEVELTEEDIEEIKEEYKPFDAAVEYIDVKSFIESDASPEEKKKRLDEYKKEKIKQQEGIAKLQVKLRRQIYETPDSSVGELMEKVYLYAPELRLTEEQIDEFKEVFETYHKKHEAVEVAREKYTDDKELFKAALGIEPKGNVKVIKGPITLYFRCSSPEDYGAARIVAEKKELNESSIQEMQKGQGVFLMFSKIPELKGLIILENATMSINPEETRTHEEQHAIYRLFRGIILRGEALKNVKKAKNIEEAREGLASFLKYQREALAERRAKDEILAFLKQGEDVQIISRMLLKKGGGYDFFENYRQHIEDNLKKFKLEKKDEEDLLEQVFVKEYRQIIKRALRTVEALEKTGKSRDEIVELLTKEHIERWPNLMRHLRQVKKNQ